MLGIRALKITSPKTKTCVFPERYMKSMPVIISHMSVLCLLKKRGPLKKIPLANIFHP